MLMRQGPLAGRYGAVATMVMFALIPYLALSAALGPLTPLISKQLHMNAQTMSLGSGLANAAYALGTVLAVQFAQHYPQRRMLVGYAVLLVIGSVLTASAAVRDWPTPRTHSARCSRCSSPSTTRNDGCSLGKQSCSSSVPCSPRRQ